MSYIMVQKSIILKGHGVYRYYGGVPYLLTAPPPEATDAGTMEDGTPIDAPPFAHYGHGKPHPSGHPGMGELIPGKFQRGKYGEMGWHSGGFDDFHGHDGVWHQIGKILEKSGMYGQHHPEIGELTPANILQHAINQHNANHHGENGFHALADVDSPEWRKINISPLISGPPEIRANRDSEGRKITGWTNRGEDQERIGTFIESLNVPYNVELQKIMLHTLGLEDFIPQDKHEWLHPKRPKNYISLEDLTSLGYDIGGRIKGWGGDISSRDGRLPDHRLTTRHDAAHQGIQSWEVAHHLPDMFHYTLQKQPTNPSYESARKHINMAFDQINENEIPDINVPINTRQTAGGTDYGMVPLKTLLHDISARENLITEMAKTPAFQFLFGKVKAGGSRPTPTNRMFMHLLDQFGGDPDKGSTFDIGRTHVQAGPHMLMPDGTKPTQKHGTHKSAADFFTKVMLAGPHEEGPSAMRHHKVDDEILANLGLNVASADTVDFRRQAVDAISDLIAISQGHQVRRQVPEEIPTEKRYASMIQGYPAPDNLISQLPSNILFTDGLGAPPISHRRPPTPLSAPPQIAGPEPLPAATPTPTQPPSGRAAHPNDAMMAEFRRRLARGPSARPQPESLVAARRAVRGYDPQQLRQFMGGSGLGPKPGTGALTPREQLFQQTFGDPHQHLLEQYLRSIDRGLPEEDRLMKAMENMQRDDAMRDDNIMKHTLPRPINIADDIGIRHLAEKMDIHPLDVRSIAHQTGDWQRIAKHLNISTDIVKVIKLSVGGV